MGCDNLRVYDNDYVEAKNYSNQLFGENQIGMKKVDALKAIVDFMGLRGKIEYHDEYITEDTPIVDPLIDDQIIILAVDSMAARKVISEPLFVSKNGLIIDVRLGKGFATGIAVNARKYTHVNTYRTKYMFSDDVAATDACTEKTYMGVSDWACQFVVNTIWAYFQNGLENYPNVVNVHCDTQRTDYVSFGK